MITVKKMIRKEQGLCLIVTELNAEAANIVTKGRKTRIDTNLVLYLEKLSSDVDNDTLAKKLKEYLTGTVFNHYVDMVAVIDYIYTVRKSMRSAMEHASHSKFIFVTEFINYTVDDDKQDECEEDGCDGDCDKDGCEKDK